VSWPEPKGGFFLWTVFPEPVNTDALLTRAVARAVVYVAGSAFYIDGRSSNLARLAFSAAPPARIDEGVRRLAAAVRDELDAARASELSAPSARGRPA
jgi:DNA-binding transcriptional MocR family regulator